MQRLIVLNLLLFLSHFMCAQNTITVAAPFLRICPDSRAGGIGESGVASSADMNSIHWNPAKLAFISNVFGASASYTPWLRKLVPDINHYYVSGYYNLRDRHALGLSFRGFTQGSIQTPTTVHRPIEFSADFAYAYQLADRWSVGGALRYIYADVTGGLMAPGASRQPARAPALDVSVYHQNTKDSLYLIYSFGVNISNMGPKMAYSNTSSKDYLPVNLRIGQRVTLPIEPKSSLAFSLDINKLMVPTTPVYEMDTTGQPVIGTNGQYVILSGMSPDRSVASGMLTSFYDAPGEIILNSNGEYGVVKGSRLKEELREIQISGGVEFWLKEQIAARAGYYHEHSTKGNHKYITLGTGLRYKLFGLDFAYIIPVNFNAIVTQRSPLENTMRFTLIFDVS